MSSAASYPGVEEVLRWWSRDQLLPDRELSPVPPEVEEIWDLDLAREWAVDQENPWVRQALVSDPLSWQDMRTFALDLELREEDYERGGGFEVEAELHDLFLGLDPLLHDYLDGRDARDVEEEIRADFAYVAVSRALTGGAGLRFFELVFAAYRAGGWPCGWRGDYPDGKLIVFARRGPRSSRD